MQDSNRTLLVDPVKIIKMLLWPLLETSVISLVPLMLLIGEELTFDMKDIVSYTRKQNPVRL